MRILVISDIHANLAALEAVLAAAKGQWDQMWCLGDIVGYGPDPDACTELLRAHHLLTLTGNHDWAVLGKLDIGSFNIQARTVIEWTQQNISEETRSFLTGQPPRREKVPFLLAHGSPRQPVWEYIMDKSTASVNFDYLEEETPLCLVGHTHIPVVYTETAPGKVLAASPSYDEPLALNGTRRIINPGSVGQPRDGDSRAAYALLDVEAMTWQFHRVPYAVEMTQSRMQQQAFPYRLIARLEYGW